MDTTQARGRGYAGGYAAAAALLLSPSFLKGKIACILWSPAYYSSHGPHGISGEDLSRDQARLTRAPTPSRVDPPGLFLCHRSSKPGLLHRGLCGCCGHGGWNIFIMDGRGRTAGHFYHGWSGIGQSPDLPVLLMEEEVRTVESRWRRRVPSCVVS